MVGTDISFTSFEIFTVSINIIMLALIIFQIIKSHHGDCRGAVISKVQTADGQCITREAKLSMHEPASHEIELEPMHKKQMF